MKADFIVLKIFISFCLFSGYFKDDFFYGLYLSTHITYISNASTNASNVKLVTESWVANNRVKTSKLMVIIDKGNTLV